MAKQRHELARGLGVAEGPANLLLHPPPPLRSLSLPSLTTPLSKKKDTPSPLHPGLLEEEGLAANHSAVYVFNKRDVCIHRSFL